MKDIFTLSLIASTIRLATPLVLAALGGLFSERSGVINIALEGKMLAGAFAAAAVTYAADKKLGMGTASPWIGLLGGMIAGLFIAVIYALSCIRFKADQVVSGAAINILMGRFLTDFYAMVDNWARWATETVRDWPADPGAAKPDLAVLAETARKAEAIRDGRS